eukprot:6276659-Prymnesium_polylepis.1
MSPRPPARPRYAHISCRFRSSQRQHATGRWRGVQVCEQLTLAVPVVSNSVDRTVGHQHHGVVRAARHLCSGQPTRQR